MIWANLSFEQKLWQNGYNLICGIDEVGRGSFAGPVVAAAVIFQKNSQTPLGIADSKLLRPQQRQRLAVSIKQSALYWAIAEIGVSTINKVGIGKATQRAFRKAIKLLGVKPDFVLIDAFYVRHLNRKRQKAVKNGDKRSASIAAASIIAKVYRDKIMKRAHYKFPTYGFAKNKGYGTKFHQEAIRKYGLSRLHRSSFNLSRFI